MSSLTISRRSSLAVFQSTKSSVVKSSLMRTSRSCSKIVINADIKEHVINDDDDCFYDYTQCFSTLD